MKQKNNPIILSLLLITSITLLAYIPLIPFLGFYSDDFFFGYIAHFYGTDGVIKSLIVDRPVNGYMLIINYFLLGLRDNVFLWHIYAFLTRLIGGYLLFLTLIKIWPKKLLLTTLITLLFLTYPGFLQQTLPLGFGNWLTTLTLWIASLYFTVLALKSTNKYRFFFPLFTAIALSFQILVFLNLEFFIGLEILRILIITYILKSKISFSTIKKTFIYWIPYFAVLAIFVLWRVFIFKSTREVTDINWVVQTYYSNPVWILKIPFEIILSLLNTIIFAYFIPIIINLIRLPLQNSLMAIFLSVVSASLVYMYCNTIKDYEHDKKFPKKLLLIGFISILMSLLPIIISGRTVRLFNVLDRYTITSIIGVSFAIVGFLFFALTSRARKWVMILLVALSLNTHLMNGYWHKIMWDRQIDLWWQLSWRAPKIKDNTMLILDFPKVTEDTLFKSIVNKIQWYRFYWAEEQIWTAGNLFFNYNNPPGNHFYGDFLQDENVLEKIKKGSVETFNNRNVIYTRDFKNSIVITTPSDVSCLKILDGDKLVIAGPYITPPKHIFGMEPSHDWCYYFQKASLLRQFGEWDKLSDLKKEVIKKGLRPKDPNEWLPFQADLR